VDSSLDHDADGGALADEYQPRKLAMLFFGEERYQAVDLGGDLRIINSGKIRSLFSPGHLSEYAQKIGFLVIF
jgi:hypothetical protein